MTSVKLTAVFLTCKASNGLCLSSSMSIGMWLHWLTHANHSLSRHLSIPHRPSRSNTVFSSNGVITQCKLFSSASQCNYTCDNLTGLVHYVNYMYRHKFLSLHCHNHKTTENILVCKIFSVALGSHCIPSLRQHSHCVWHRWAQLQRNDASFFRFTMLYFHIMHCQYARLLCI